jgi:hypothetical protein
MSVKTYVTKPQEVRALQWTGNNRATVLDFTNEGWFSGHDEFYMHEKGRSIPVLVMPGMWLTKDVHGDIEILTDKDFQERYDEVTD